jgi:hypothetical protein
MAMRPRKQSHISWVFCFLKSQVRVAKFARVKLSSLSEQLL